MNFALTDEQKAIQAAVRDLARAGRAPAMADLSALGLFGILAPSDVGGAGLGVLDACLCLEELAARDPSAARTVHVHNFGCVAALLAAGSDEQRVRLLPDLASGKSLGTLGWTRDGVTARNVPHGAEAAVLLVIGPEGAQVATGRRHVFGKPRTLGFRETLPVDISLIDAGIEPLRGDLEGVLSRSNIGLAALAVGIARGALEHACTYATERHQFGGPIKRFQAIQWKIADSATLVDAARMLVTRAADLADRGRPVAREAAMARTAAVAAALAATDHAVQIHGGYGYVADFPVERLYRDARACSLTDGTGDEARDCIASSLFGRA